MICIKGSTGSVPFESGHERRQFEQEVDFIWIPSVIEKPLDRASHHSKTTHPKISSTCPIISMDLVSHH
jgi:hypothetical protein